MPDLKAKAEVRVAKTGLNGRPTAEVLVDSKISAAQLAGLIQNVTTNKQILAAGGLRACTGCKSGLDILIRDRFQAVVDVEV